MDYLEGLNEPQREAVLHSNGPLMIIAGAGSGKTRVLTHRIAHLIQNNVEAFHIMSLTFTNKAAAEMRKRIEQLIGADAKNIWMGTFHSIFARILRIEAQHIGFTSNFSIYDTDDSKSLIKNIVKELSLDDKLYKPNTILNKISNAKNNLISYLEYNSNPIYLEDDTAFQRPEIGKIYKIYQERCLRSNALDFDDILFYTNVLFRDHLDVLYKYQHKFKYLMIDEFQDTNLSQYLIVRKLSNVHQNICVVGDDAQSIYAFRGANIQNILNFAKDYPDLSTIRLEQNYRSTKTIVGAANSLIAKNKNQLPKSVWTDNEPGSLIKIHKSMTDQEEGRWVAGSIFEDKGNLQLKNSDFAILYRTNAQSRAMEEALRRTNLRYKIIGGISFYQRREIKDLLAYLRFVVNPNDEEAFKRIVNLPKRGIGDGTVAKLLAFVYDQGALLWDALQGIQQFMTGRNVATIEGFVSLILLFQHTNQQKDAYETAKEVANKSGLLKDLYEDKTVEGLARYENVQELLNAVKEFTDNEENQDKSLSAFLQEVSLLTSADDDKGDDDKITLMTIHSAKGLEFKNVFVVGLEEDLFPSTSMMESRQDLEEERRLFYVAITRAEKKLNLSFAAKRYHYGRLKDCEPSRFLFEIDKDFLNPEKLKTAKIETNNSFVKNLRITKTVKPINKPQIQYQPSPNFKASDTKLLEPGMKVEHIKFGFGRVKEVEVMGNDKKAKIDFEEHGEKTLLLSFAKLQIHEG